MAVDLEKLNLKAPWQDLTVGMMIHEGGTSKEFHTGEWTAVKPHVNENICRQCLLCVQVCPDSAIPYDGNGRVEVDTDHCKGCGICAHVCPFGAIEMEGF
ncbi:MAG TPA: 4Fe-4S binding protein [Candidatus Fimousia stercorigallinarum]|nr:4Fe-4S binding protein [Candidatus Fimousia stercorigallinarum]